MSGGSMEYAYCRINDAADYIQRELAEYELRKRSGVAADKPSDCYAKEHPEDKRMTDGELLRESVIEHLKDALLTVRKAAIYAERVEWLTSGDDGDESFVLRIEDELAECDKRGGVR